MDLKQIKPKENNKDDKYSWQLYNYFKKNKYDINSVKVIFDSSSWFDGSHVEFDKDDLKTRQIWIGFIDNEGWLTGNTLGSIIGIGNKKYELWANPWLRKHEHIDITDWFWDEYIKIGRCIWDKLHERGLANDEERFTYIDEDARVCNWCGEKQIRKIEEKVIVEKIETWNRVEDI